MLLLIDNFDSFTHLLASYFSQLGEEVCIIDNQNIYPQSPYFERASHVVISPGPGHPVDAGNTLACIKAHLGQLPFLGVCLGHQALALACGGRLRTCKQLYHGKTSLLNLEDSELFKKMPPCIRVMRYHSLGVETTSLPPCLRVIASSEDGEIMAFEHQAYSAWGVQFHPESILSQYGKTLLKNFLTASYSLKSSPK